MALTEKMILDAIERTRKGMAMSGDRFLLHEAVAAEKFQGSFRLGWIARARDFLHGSYPQCHFEEVEG